MKKKRRTEDKEKGERRLKGLFRYTTHAKAMTMKSSQFHASLRYVKGFKIKPRAITLTADSNV